jgi:hypothetical protein
VSRGNVGCSVQEFTSPLRTMYFTGKDWSLSEFSRSGIFCLGSGLNLIGLLLFLKVNFRIFILGIGVSRLLDRGSDLFILRN